MNECPCGGLPQGAALNECCGPYVIDGVPAPTPEKLMRSRYTAFVLRNDNHLLRTWHPSTRPKKLGSLDDVTWKSLKVLRHNGGEDDATTGTVDFDATFESAGQIGHVREHSRFAIRAGRWFYVDGDELS